MKKSITTKISKVLDNKARLGIMSMLMVNDRIDFNTFKEMLELSDGGLASHLKVLEKEQYIEIHKQFIGKKPNTSYAASDVGRKAFKKHLDILEAIIKQTQV